MAIAAVSVFLLVSMVMTVLLGDDLTTETVVTSATSQEDLAEVAARTGIPLDAVTAYISAANAYHTDQPDLIRLWTLLAGIGEEECDHGRLQADGCLPDTANFCGARGPMQFLGNTWRRGTDSVPSGDCPGSSSFTGNPVGPPLTDGPGDEPDQKAKADCDRVGGGYATDGDGDGDADPWVWLDATHAAARYLLCNGLADGNVERAIRRYNNSSTYVNAVQSNARRFRDQTSGIDLTEDIELTAGGASGTYALPLEGRWYDQHPDWFTKPHHDYPAADIPVPTGTPVFAAASGQVITAPTTGKCGTGVMIRGDDGADYIYCHGTDGGDIVQRGDHVDAGDLIMHSGNTGNSTGPHLHFGIRIGEIDHCPQPFFEAIVDGTSVDVHRLPTSGCSN